MPQMPQVTRNIITLTRSIWSEGPVIRQNPIGRIQEGRLRPTRKFSAFSGPCSKGRSNERFGRCTTEPPVGLPRIGYGIRFQSTKNGFPGGVGSTPKRSDTKPLLGAVLGASALAFVGQSLISRESEEVAENPIKSDDDVNITDTDDDHKIRLAEVPNHDRDAERKWIVRETGVYDITDFIEQHPGGEVILRACGGSVDPYWKMFSIHQKQEVYDILKEFYIGEIDERDLDDAGHINWDVLGPEAVKNVIDDPFKYDPERDQALIFQTQKPCNAETPGNMLTDFITPIRLFFVRNHLWVPQTQETPKSITIELSDGEEQTYSIDDLKANFKEHTITATLQCAGNRRGHMSKSAPGPTSGLQWDVGAIGTAEFSGVRLRDVLKDAGYCVDGDCPAPKQCEDEDLDMHIHFTSPGDTYAASIPLQTAINPQADVILAWNMNGQPINRDHGGPLRAIVPGTTAARSVKWLGKISISSEEAQSQWQKRDYKCFGPNIKQSEVTGDDWDEAQAIQETPVQSVITNILKANGQDKTTVQGFAFSGGGRAIVRVDVSADGGKTWKQADLHEDKAKGSKRWAWTMWSIGWSKDEVKPGTETEFVVKATDEAYNTQPQSFDSTWNFRGLCANAWHSMKAAS